MNEIEKYIEKKAKKYADTNYDGTVSGEHVPISAYQTGASAMLPHIGSFAEWASGGYVFNGETWGEWGKGTIRYSTEYLLTLYFKELNK